MWRAIKAAAAAAATEYDYNSSLQGQALSLVLFRLVGNGKATIPFTFAPLLHLHRIYLLSAGAASVSRSGVSKSLTTAKQGILDFWQGQYHAITIIIVIASIVGCKVISGVRVNSKVRSIRRSGQLDELDGLHKPGQIYL